jgi:hypothetical protein
MTAGGRTTALIVLTGIALCGCAELGRNCGFERQPVKVAADRDKALIDPAVRETTLAALTAISAPRRPEERYDARYRPVETTIWRVRAMLQEIGYFEEDGDYDLILTDNAGRTMIAEAPDPACATGSVLAAPIAAVRAKIAARFPTVPVRPGIPVTVTGVGFFDVVHDPATQAPNGIELHPITAIEWELR